MLYEDENECGIFDTMARNTLRDLWFILTLPLCEFGQIINSLSMPDYAQLNTTTTPASLVPLPTSRGSDLQGIKELYFKAHITGRCTYLFRASHQDKEVVFKLTWLRTNRLPEGTVYKVLEDGNVPNLPTIFASGILVKEFCGHRLEYLVVEYCGESIVDYVRSMHKNGALASNVAKKVKLCTRSVMHTLAAALRSNVLHRDVSPGNITADGTRVFVIDWGCAKLTALPSAGQAADMFSRWGFDSSGVVGKESEKDPFTGTQMYMSIPTLFKICMRGVFNEIESLFYVVLDSLSDRIRGRRSGDALGFALYSESNLAMVRIGILGGDRRCLGDFGVGLTGPSGLKNILDAVRKFLFFEGDLYVGGRLQDFCERRVGSSVAARFMDQTTLNLLTEILARQQAALMAQSVPSSPVDSTTLDPSAMAICSQPDSPRWQIPPTAIAASSGDGTGLVNRPLLSHADDSFELVMPVFGTATTSLNRGSLECPINEQATSSASLPGPAVNVAEQSNPAAPAGDVLSRKRNPDEKMDDDSTEEPRHKRRH
ncbi:hypothetical protein GGI03_003626 [Coemansia sp. RSA 2337]|nr:hypothetical protein GGI14_005182 [Coemansia sp. S680]KAJ2033088.1 hypothetical protein H4S03_005883 [Coemansia sp. S3946]KAJ2042939.1 hypothetical protein H4S04_007035 [Coemansia sp. S16]KAJ2066866.1 hypothetical protein GGI08_001662 [Coemansia sp. S2]KAJ2108320.1 hypothetical protein IW146_006889 [Coemansia sp. RSA 922]KAJ2351882.1 hypothetical protein GGH92_001580 [Coemansia sp. RSA 2673]KAJ2463777.1 hypothetical protein GGI03_003626 [Coemansia sp. RSA 2337]